MKREIWKSVLGYIGLYEVSNYGRVRSLKHEKIRILKQLKHTNGYLKVNLCKDGITKIFYVHRLVYEAFNGFIPDGYEINHINEDKTDNRLDNLNLLTHGENIRYGTANQRRAEKLSDQVLQLTLDEVLVKEWPSIAEAGRHGFNLGAVCACCRGKLKQYKGFKWVKKLPLS